MPSNIGPFPKNEKMGWARRTANAMVFPVVTVARILLAPSLHYRLKKGTYGSGSAHRHIRGGAERNDYFAPYALDTLTSLAKRNMSARGDLRGTFR